MATIVPVSDDSYTKDDNLEIFSLIWLDTNVNVKDSQHTEQQLRNIINHFKKFEDALECQQYIEQRSKEDRIVLIVSDQLNQEMVSRIHQLRQVSSIYVHCTDKSRSKQWTSKFSKVVIVQNDEFITQLESDQKLRVKIQEPLSINIFSTNSGAGTSTTGLNGQFVYSQLLIDCLLRMKSSKKDNMELMLLCEKAYAGNNSQLSIVHEFQCDYSPDKVLWWYTRESFFYKILNKALRAQNIHMLFLFRSFISDIHHQLQHYQSKCPLHVYRSQLMSSDELNNLQQYIGQFISINSFLSTSVERKVALFYMGQRSELDNLEQVLFEINADPHVVTTKPFANISEFSQFVEESEVLFMIGSIFRLTNISRSDDQMWVIQMTLCGDDEHDLRQVVVHMKNRYGSGETNLWSVGRLLWEMGKSDLAKQYYLRLLNELDSEDPLHRTACEDLAKMASQQGDYDTSIQWRKKALEIKTRTSSIDYANVNNTNRSLGYGLKQAYLENLHADFATMPPCAEKTIMKLLEHFELMLLGDCTSSQNECAVSPLLDQLQDQVKKQELLSEEIRMNLRDLNRIVQIGDCSSVVHVLGDLLKKIQPLNIQEIQRLVEKAKKAAALIHDKEIILLIGETGSGKSTTIQFLAGCKMEKTLVEIEPGKFLEHITVVEPVNNPELCNVTSRPLNMSETRYIVPVRIELKEIFGPDEKRDIIICDAPDLSDATHPEVDIANCVGVIEAVKGCASVKLFVLLSYESLGGRGQGIQKLAHLLIDMVYTLENRLHSIFYTFTKYPVKKDINALLVHIKTSKVDADPCLRWDRAFMTVLKDMINKTEKGAQKIDPTQDDPKKLVEKLQRVTGIAYPEEVFRFSMRKETQAIIENQVQRYNLGIRCAVKHRDNALVMYYLDNLKTLNGLIKQSFVRDTYEDSIHFVGKEISEYCEKVMRNFNRALASQDNMNEKDVRDYETAIEYIQKTEILRVHLGSQLMSAATLIQNIDIELQKRRLVVAEEDLHSPLIEIYLDKLCMLKNSFRELEMIYSESCNYFADRFDELVKTASGYILANEFQKVAEIILTISESSHFLKSHLGEKVEQKYTETVALLLKYLSSFSKKVEPLLEKVILNDNDVKVINECMMILRSAKETLTLQDRILTYAEMLEKGADISGKNFKNLNEIYNEFTENIVKYFDNINVRIRELFEKSGDYALEQIEKLVSDMEMIRTIPGLEAKTTGMYYRTVENVRGYTQQLQKDAEQLLAALDQKSGVTNYGNLARSLSRLKHAEWINRVSPGTYDVLMRRITEELVQHAQELEERLMKLDFHLKCPNGISAAHEIVAKIESMSVLDRSVPELEKYRLSIVGRFRQTIEGAFDRIQQTFNLQDKNAYALKHDLKTLEQIKREYENLHPARKYLQEQEYSSIDQLESEIENLESKQQEELKRMNELQREKDKQLEAIDGIIREYMNLVERPDKSAVEEMKDTFTGGSQKDSSEAENYLKKCGYSNIHAVYEVKLNISKDYDNKFGVIEDNDTELKNSLNCLQLIRKQYDWLSEKRDSVSPEEIRYLQENGQKSIEALDAQIEKNMKIISELERYKQTYSFTDKLDAAVANHALLYVSECEKVGHFHIKETAAEMNTNLQKYIREYGNFLNQEINRLYKNASNIDVEGGPFQYSHELSMRLEELSSFSKFVDVFQCINGVEKIEHWKQEFFDCYRTLTGKMEEYRGQNDARNLRKQLTIVQTLNCLDHFCSGNKFNDLYRKYHGNMSEDFREIYKNVLNYISKLDYANAALSLSEIDDKPLNEKALRQIQHELQSSLTKLMKDTKCMAYWLHGKIEREERNRQQIKDIKDNVDKIRIALSQDTIMHLLDDKSKIDLKKFDGDIDKILSETILKGLHSVEKFMVDNHFAETEQGIENISHVQHELIGYCTSPEVNKKTEELKAKLSKLVDEISTKDDFTDIERYFENPPKDLLAKLKTVGSNDPRYGQSYTTLLGKLRLNFSAAIDKVRSVPRKERALKLRSLNYALCFVPDELQSIFKMHIDEMNENMKEEEKEHTRELDVALKYRDENEHTIAKIGQLAKEFQEKDMNEFSEKLHEEITKRLQIYRANIQASLDQNDMQSAVDIMDKIIKYKEHVSKYIPEIKGIYDNTRNSTIKSFEKCSKILAEIAKIEKPEIVEKAFSNTIVCVEFSNTNKEFLPKTTLQNCRKDLGTMHNYLNDNSEKYRDALKSMTVDDLHTTMVVSKRWDTLLQEIKECPNKHSSVKSILPDVQNVIVHTEMIYGVENEIDNLETQLDVPLISDDTTKFETKREEFFSQLKKSTSLLKEVNFKLKDLLPTPVNLEKTNEKLKKKVCKISEQLLDIASKSELTQVEYDHFRKYYNHLLAFKKHLNLSDVDVQSSLDESKTKVFEKVQCLRKEFVDSGENIEKAVDTLIKMKLFAENLSMFDNEINGRLDEALKACKDKNGPAYLTKLSMRLEETDVGVRIMSEHTLWKGEDWRKRKEKMQHQDDLDYILDRLEGDDLNKNVLKVCYLTFRKEYEDILINNLITSDQSQRDSNLDVLISNIKYFADKVAPNSTRLSLNQTFKDKAPELLSHIFAIWTLQNTEYYNAARGIEKQDEYLLTPHVGQILAIFRILGIGYENSGSATTLFNNLVQIETGDGKSVVIAVTACVFALMGVDVNCSCYNEVLSTRDKESFAPLFSALGIQEYIEYGTFNKLCENLLKEQCDVRAKVSDMILTNASTFSKIETKKRVRPKVLLIDEVDVFLSEKYYGGIYSSVVYLKHPTIKSLLDTIWENRTIRTLNGIKVMPAYRECANQFSNWTFLLDEAIKDMIAALKSFLSSTYLVQNDRIVYVEGESITENVVRGYATIWAYYQENRNGKISASSLEANVGIIVNCGTFSYAEMAHDFAYITGVTGTLKTLATSEKAILANVYAVHKNTYMPSVFGACRRNYNPASDVHTVNETDYFNEIRGEIDVICNAKRAILVFFESEDKLMKFYNSPQLSPIKETVQVITEKVSVKDRERYIKCAATIGKVTLLTRTFGRGTDFKCNDQQLLANGGIHILQTFFSEELSEEYHIMGRGARQEDSGSYRMILLDKDLEWILGASWAAELPKILGSTLYENLSKARNTIFESKCSSKGVGIEQCKGEHASSKNFIKALNEGDIITVKKFLMQENQGANIYTDSSRTVLLMDGTGSMSSLLSAAKETVCTIFERAATILNQIGLPNDVLQMQFAIYRNYRSKDNKILEVSSWETKASNLRTFMNGISPEGGMGAGAIEIGFWHAARESETQDGISQVILIGDTPVNTKFDVTSKQAYLSKAYWKQTRFAIPIYYEDELRKLKNKNIPIHAFYLTKYAKDSFEKIASETGGRCEWLNIQSSQGAEFLIHCVTEEILRKTADNQAVELYRKKYVKTFTS